MAGHHESCSESADLCDQLFAELKRRIESLSREEGDNWCGYRGGGKIFAYAAHSSGDGWLKVWFRGTPNAAASFPKLTIKPRNPTSGTWKKFGGSFKVYNQSHVEEAAQLLSQYSFPLSINQE